MTWDIGRQYKKLEECSISIVDWDTCPNCQKKPRLWLFDNGCYAKCKCDTKYGKASAEGINIEEWLITHNNSASDYDTHHHDLRENWNKVVEVRNRKIKIDNILNK